MLHQYMGRLVKLESPLQRLVKNKNPLSEIALGAASGRFVFSIRQCTTGQWFSDKNTMCRHGIRCYWALLALWKRSGGAGVALEPMWTQGAGQNQVMYFFDTMENITNFFTRSVKVLLIHPGLCGTTFGGRPNFKTIV